LLCTFCSVSIVPTGTLRLPWLRGFRAFSSVVRQMPGYNSQRRGTVRTLPKLNVLFCVLFVCKCVLYYCHRASAQLQLTNLSIFVSTYLSEGPRGRLIMKAAMVCLTVLCYYLLEELRNTRMGNLEPADPRIYSSFTKFRNSQV